ncbi:MAG: 16S rRNA (guanine(966)-N(2))-methyltransferase RsmD [Hyphomonas sp.]
MRIIAGQHKGRALAAPKGQGTRPTADGHGGSFNVLAHADWAPGIEGARVIDLFAGSGALGLEAMSRGAAFCLFVETDHAARGAIRDNIEALGLYGNTRLHRRSATDLGEKPAGVGSPFSLAFLDPPYHRDLVNPALDCLVKGNWLAPDAVAVVETASDEMIAPAGWEILDTRDYGAARVWFLKRS